MSVGNVQPVSSHVSEIRIQKNSGKGFCVQIFSVKTRLSPDSAKFSRYSENEVLEGNHHQRLTKFII